ncbi:acyl-CoA synthetase [Nocardia inohanensis]|uniref:acyl-CoA synthetase n=1 Tax=Nocardia inohanensis TaxID=209246 RepID=UPI0008308A84|nr:AMP-binding protein [Nocardia inohanensis]
MLNVFESLVAVGARAAAEITYLRLCARSGVLEPESPARLLAMGLVVRRFGVLGGLAGIAAIRHGDRVAIIDERGETTYAELDRRTNAIANGWRTHGLRAGEGVAILARNHRGFLEATIAAAKCGARIILLNTDFAGPQLHEVMAREGVDLLVHDEEFAALLTGPDPLRGCWRAWTDAPADGTLDALARDFPTTAPPAPGRAPKVVILTSGTSGTPKGAPRPEPRSLAPVAAILSRVPLRAGEVIECAVPMFHALGFGYSLGTLAFGSTLVLRRRFDPATTLESLERHRVTTAIMVPIMVRRILDLGDEAIAARDLSRLRIMLVAGSHLGAELCRRAMAVFGPVLYNGYGSTEVAYITVANPQDLRAAPGCVGRPPLGVTVKLLDDAGNEVPQGVTGRIFVRNTIPFEGYTGGGGKEIIDSLMASGDVGHFDAAGRLFVDGRDDDMIVSGGENVFPGEIEELLSAHEAIVEAAVLGVPDPEFGQRLAAFVVPAPGAELTEDSVKQYVRAHLARYKTPRDVILLDTLPRNPAGKVLKRELPVRETKVP